MSLAACAALVARGDPDRHAATLAAPPEARDLLWPLYAFNLEIARAPWVTAEPLIAEMRLQWWADRLAGIAAGEPRPAHEVAGPLCDLLRARGLDPAPLVGLVEARRWDCWSEPFAGADALAAYLDATAGGLMWTAAAALGAPPPAEPVVRDVAQAAGLAAWLRAVPELRARGRHPLPDPRPEALAALARDGLARLARARAARARVPRAAAPALFPAWQAGAVLRRALADPARVAAGGLAPSEFSRRAGLAWRAFTGRW